MSNMEKYRQAFIKGFSLDEGAVVDNLEYNTIPEWDSIGHMTLIAELEEAFAISMETDDIVELGSFAKGMEILKKYDVAI